MERDKTKNIELTSADELAGKIIDLGDQGVKDFLNWVNQKESCSEIFRCKNTALANNYEYLFKVNTASTLEIVKTVRAFCKYLHEKKPDKQGKSLKLEVKTIEHKENLSYSYDFLCDLFKLSLDEIQFFLSLIEHEEYDLLEVFAERKNLSLEYFPLISDVDLLDRVVSAIKDHLRSMTKVSKIIQSEENKDT